MYDSRRKLLSTLDSRGTRGHADGRPNEPGRLGQPGETIPSLDYYAELDAEIDDAEDDAIRARWQFGRALLTERVGKKLPPGRLETVAGFIGKSPTEIRYRMLFASRFQTEAAFVNAIDEWRSWYAIVNDGLASTAHLSSAKDEWATPQDLFDVLDAEFRFTVDVCARPANAKCERYWTPDDDGLTRDWTGEVCWMNPPYSVLENWVVKALDASRQGATVVCLVPSRTDVGWFWEYARHGEIRFLRGRLSFVDDLGNTGPAPFPSVVVVFGDDYPPDLRWYER
jgi:site-specific DNA-methyltransferase (adenine-specific)